MDKISVLLPCFNSASRIRATLESVRWADEIVVVDSFSTDGTLEICREYTDRVYQHEYVNSAAQKNWALSFCSHDWVLQVDSDEVLEEGLEQEIRRAVSAGDPGTTCYRIPRKNYVYGRWVDGCGLYPDYQDRLFRRSASRFGARAVHAKIETSGRYGRLRGHLLHDDFKDIGGYLLKFERYMGYELQELLRKEHRLRWYDLYLKPPAVLLRCYVLQGGWRCGFRGLLQSVVTAAYVFFKYAKLWEHRWKSGARG